MSSTPIARADLDLLQDVAQNLRNEDEFSGADAIDAAVAEIEVLRVIAENRSAKREREKQAASRIGKQKGRTMPSQRNNSQIGSDNG